MAETRGLSDSAHRPLESGETYRPYIPAEESLAEFTLKSIFFGGMLRLWLERRAASKKQGIERRDKGVLLGSGFVGGEGLLGVGIAGYAFMVSRKPEGLGTGWLGPEWFVQLAGLAAFVLFAAWFVRRIRRGE